MRKHHDRQKHRGHSDVLEGWRQGGWQAQSLWMKDPGRGKSVCELGQGAGDTGANERGWGRSWGCEASGSPLVFNLMEWGVFGG